MSTEAKIDGKPVEAEVDDKKEETKKEEKEVKKAGKAKKIIGGIVGGLAATGAVAWGVLKILAMKNDAPTGFSEPTETESSSESETEG